MNGLFYANTYDYVDETGQYLSYVSGMLHSTRENADKASKDEWAYLKEPGEKLVQHGIKVMYTVIDEDPEEASRKAWHALGNDYCEAMEELKETTRQ